jgi:hypothetical protein
MGISDSYTDINNDVKIDSLLRTIIQKYGTLEKAWNDPDPIIFSIKQYLYNSVNFNFEISEFTKKELIDKCINRIRNKDSLIIEFRDLLSSEIKTLVVNKKRFQIVFFYVQIKKILTKLFL